MEHGKESRAREGRVMEMYQNVKDWLEEYEYTPTPAEATFIRRLIREFLDEEPSKGAYNVFIPTLEIMSRFLWGYYGIHPADVKALKEDTFTTVLNNLRHSRERM